MRRRVWVSLLVFSFGVAVATMMTGCWEVDLRITSCLGSDYGPNDWFGRPPLTICMRGILNPGGIASWNFGDSTTGSGSSVSHTYTEVGEHNVVLDVLYSDGKLESTSATVVVAGEPEAAFTYNIQANSPFSPWFSWLPSWMTGNQEPDEEDESLEINFDASTSYPTDTSPMYIPAQLHWDFGDGAQETVKIYAKSKIGRAHV